MVRARKEKGSHFIDSNMEQSFTDKRQSKACQQLTEQCLWKHEESAAQEKN